jgi:hypothetical protein
VDLVGVSIGERVTAELVCSVGVKRGKHWRL